MGKRRAGSQTGSLTPDHKKSGIDLFPTSELKAQYVVEKISTRATSLVQTSSRSDLKVGSYDLPKSRDSTRDSFGTISGLQLGSPGKKSHLDVASAGWRRGVNPLRGGRQQPHQSLEKLRKYKGGSRRHEMAASPSPKMRM